MPKSDRFKILYNKEIVFSNLPKNSVAYNIIKHMVEKRDFKYEELERLFNNVKNLSFKTKEIIKKKENISSYRDKSEQDNMGNSKSRQRSYLPTKDTNFIVCKNEKNENIEIGVWTEWEYKNFPIFVEYLNSLDLGYKINEVEESKVLHNKNYSLDFIDIIKKQITNRSYKIALLSCFLDIDKMKSNLTYDEIFNSLKKYYSIPRHRADLSDIDDLESWNKSKYINRIKQTAMKYLPEQYFILDEVNETYRLCDEIAQYVTDSNFVKEFKEAVEFLENKYFNKGVKDIVKEKEITNKSQEEVINHIHSYITSQGYEYDYTLISNLYLSLKTKPFVILAGISGTGKSKIARLFAQALGATRENNQFNMISVRPDWNDSTDLIGYKDLESKFIKGKLTQIIEDASENLDKPYFVCLDEMNLARVEYYLSDYLSVIESRQLIGETIVTDSLIYDDEIEDEDSLKLPENLYLIGTVNMDDTTFQFSRKVLDRANTIEFSEVNLENLFENETKEVENMTDVYNDFLKSTYLKTTHIEFEYRDYAKEINKKIIQINNILSKFQKQFAYRVRDEILFYMIENKKANLLSDDVAFDYQIIQKVLPAINGSENSIKEVLVNLFNFVCEKDILNDSDIEEAENYLQLSPVKYRKSAEKIVYMLKGYNYDGYASYWY
ncbi:McrB family protein [Terrisporobacter muris]|uniref:AAA family ATPase n=1 Tax=Terrisporobacter muris TaxID=2963284 RepID=A0A9X2M7B3_9FIRM|nr:AAA family ATPase [Terrisporobacter muris]MCR1821180.1 AAA family ATPase [Terrisporobacter muris]